MNLKCAIALFLALGAMPLGCAKHDASGAATAVERHTTVGVITGFGDNNKVVTIKHKTFPDGFMQGMEMSFELQDASMAAGFKVGDQVEFTLEHRNDSFPIVSMKKVP